MKIFLLGILTAAILLAGCTRPPDPSENMTESHTITENGARISDTNKRYDGNVLIFQSEVSLPEDFYAYPAASAHAAVRAYFDEAIFARSMQLEEAWYNVSYDDYHAAQDSKAPFQPYTFEERAQIQCADDAVLSLVWDCHANTGGVHESTEIRCDTFDQRDGSRLTLDQVLADGEAGYDVLIEGVRTQIKAHGSDSYYADADDLAETMFDPTLFCLTEDALLLYYQPYSIAPYAAGAPSFAFPREALSLNPDIFGS